ncbi:hypothetical protein ACIPUC_17680 [Streptomyces sp. LARHCF249]
MNDMVDRGAHLAGSARGWLTVQLSVLGFVGLCGALKGGGASSAPKGVELLAGVLILLALAVACFATWLVARVAWPLDPEGGAGTDGGGRRLRTGIALTFVAVGLVAVATTSSWWPADRGAGGPGGLVEVSTSAGTWCGTLGSGGDGVVRLSVAGRSVDIPVSSIAALTPTSACSSAAPSGGASAGP